MSNQAVGNVYKTIIEEVINSSRVDFEESGVEEGVLEELRQGWQQKLSQLDVAQFPWDPKPEPPPANQPPPGTASSSTNHSHAQFSPVVSLPEGVGSQNGIKTESGVQVKQEPGAQAMATPQFPGYNGMDNNTAASRAAQQLQAQYGVRAAGSINAIHGHVGQQQQQLQGDAATQQQLPVSSLSNGQTDGAIDDADDVEGVLLQRTATGNLQELGRVDIDRMLHAQIAAKAKSMEGGGLMVPLQQAMKARSQSTARGRNAKGKGIAGYDGGDDDDEEDDEDAINSDLDDPDEDHDEDEVDDEGLGHIMLCMYDKVQRVKNKWKCTLKDGVLTVNGKEYVFHKATGEYEW